MSMVEQFFSIEYADRGDLFEGMAVWEEEKYRKLQGSYPVISISFAALSKYGFDLNVALNKFLVKSASSRQYPFT